MGLDISIYMVHNRKQLDEENFWTNFKTGWPKDEYDNIDYTQPSEVYYARKFWDLYSPVARRLHIDNCEYSAPLTKEDIEYMIDIATHCRDYFGGFQTVPDLCEILDNYDEATEKGMVFIFEGNY